MTLQLWTHCRLATMQPDAATPYGLVDEGALVVDGEHIAWAGPREALPRSLTERVAVHHDAEGALITPGLIDCHTHLVYGGDRAGEFEQRLNGASYEDIARAGGGIASTVRATRAADASTLKAQSLPRLRALRAEGVTTVEIKSGYGLALDHERKTLQVARELAMSQPVDVRTTFLGAHAVPPEFAGRTDDYLAEVLRMLPVLHAEGLVDAVDAFCERIAFSPAQTRQVFEAAQGLGLPVKLHAEQLSDSGGAALAAEFGALSCDHLEWLSTEGAAAMAQAGTVAVLLPGAFYFLRETRLPPVALLTVLLGLALGIQRLRLRRRYPRGLVTPYRGWKRWHHLLGLGAGGFALTWLLSGWLSNHPFGLLEFSSLPRGSAERLAGGPFKPSDSVELLRRQLARDPDAREAEWSRFAGRSYLEVPSPGHSQRLDDNAAPSRPIPPETLAEAIRDIEGKPIARVELIHEADLYHYGRRNPAVLPAARIRLADEQDTTWYLDPASGRVLARIDNPNRLHRWVFNGLHRLDFPPLTALPALREALITLLCLLGITLASTGCVLGWRRLRHRKPAP